MTNLLTYEFFQNALIAGVLIGILLPIIGIVVLLRRMTFIADSFGHINMAGIAFAIFITSLVPALTFLSPIITLIWTILAAILIEFLRNKYKNYKELSITIVYSLSIALMMIFLSLSGGYNSSLFSVLFGNINGLNRQDVIFILISFIFIISLITLNYKKIILLSLEEEYSKLYNVNVTVTKYLTMILIALTITIAIKAIGVLLVSSLIIIPLLAASNISGNLKHTLIFSIIFTEISIVFGLYGSYFLNVPTSALIVIISIFIYLISIKFKKS